ncbi:O-antigen ligase family protein [Methyloligella solikamskensis]|uniref:O-antigen ligase family protein n=1 Tax=Methyloligella solikamskensis TaxID=1177756 RepID=A0ABW3J578_9HYPH
MRSFGVWLAAALTPLIGIASFLCLVTPRITVVALALFALVILSLALLEGSRLRDLITPDLGFWLFVGTGVYLAINATWSEDLGRALNKAVLFILFALLSIGTVRAVLAWPEERARRAARGFVIGVALGSLYLFIEVISDQILVRGLFNLLPFTRPGDFKGMVVEDGVILSIRLAELNRGIALLLMSLWPVLLCVVGRRRGLQGWLIGGAVFAYATFIILASEHNTSQMAIVVTLVAFLAAYFFPRPSWLAVTAAWCLSFVVVVPLAITAYQADLHHAKWLPYSAQARIVLWSYTAHAVPDAPVLGIGGSSSRAMAAEPEAIAKAKAAKEEGKAYAWQAGPHAHNQYLQAWYELGLVGVVLVLASGAWVLWIIGRLPDAQLPYMVAHFAAFAALSASAWGMWQTWLMALPGLAAVYGAIAVAATRKPAA